MTVLAGVRVVEMADWVAGPFAASLCSGVIKPFSTTMLPKPLCSNAAPPAHAKVMAAQSPKTINGFRRFFIYLLLIAV